jgi:hypothetical protein
MFKKGAAMHIRKNVITWIFLGSMVAVSTQIRASEVVSQIPAQAVQSQIVRAPLERQMFSGTCTAAVTPDQVVVITGFSAKGLKATEVGLRLDQTGKLISKKAEQLGGKAVLKDRLRGAQTMTLRSDNAEQAPYTAVQLVDIEFPVTTEIERAVDALIPLGLDRFGREIQLEPSSSSQPFVFYRVQDPIKSIEIIFDTCKRMALTQACTNAMQPMCDLPAEKVIQCARVDYGSLHAEAHNGRNRTTLNIEHPPRGAKSLESSGRGSLQFTGQANFSFASACVTP